MFVYHPLSEATRSRLRSGGIDPDAVSALVRMAVAEDLAGVDDLAAETLHAQSLGVGVTTVTGRASALFVCHCCAFLGLT